MDARERRMAGWVAVAVALALLPSMIYTLPPGGGKAAEGALRVLDGETPYRDFWSMYAPGQFALVSVLFRVFGRELLVPAIGAVVLHAASAGVFALVAMRLGASRRGAGVLGVVLGLSFFRLSAELGSYPPALLLILGALWNTLAWFDEGWDRRLWHAGLLLGMAALFKHDVAAYWMVGTILALWVSAWATRGRRPAEWGSPLRASLVLGAGGLAVVTPVVLVIAFTAGADAWRDLIVFPATDFRLVRREAYPGLLPDLGAIRAWLASPGDLGLARDAGSANSGWVLCNAPQVAWVVGVVVLALRARRLEPRRVAAFVLVLACMPLFWLAAHVQQNTHLTTMGLGTFLLVVLVRGHEGQEGGITHPLALRALLLLAVFQGAGLLIQPAMQGWLLVRWGPNSVPLGLPGTAGLRVSRGVYDDLVPLVELVRASTTPRERIHVGVRHNDAIVLSNPRFYWLCERRPATRYSELHPAITDRAAIQREMIRDLENHHVRCAVIWSFGWHTPERIEQIVARRKSLVPDCGSGLLDAWFEERFEPVLVRGEYAVWWRKDAARPAAIEEVTSD